MAVLNSSLLAHNAGMNRASNWTKVVIAVLIGSALTVALSVLQHRFKAGSVPDLVCEVLSLPGGLVAALFHDRGNGSPEFLWRSRTATAAILSGIAWLILRGRRTVSS
jgi:hypothetical protein